jgi:hypothetical protein
MPKQLDSIIQEKLWRYISTSHRELFTDKELTQLEDAARQGKLTEDDLRLVFDQILAENEKALERFEAASMIDNTRMNQLLWLGYVKGMLFTKMKGADGYNHAPPPAGFPRIWFLFGFVLSREVRERVYGPALQDLLETYLTSRRFRSKWARRWLTAAFLFRSAVLVVDCIRVGLTSRVADFVFQFLPAPLRELWRPRQD